LLSSLDRDASTNADTLDPSLSATFRAKSASSFGSLIETMRVSDTVRPVLALFFFSCIFAFLGRLNSTTCITVLLVENVTYTLKEAAELVGISEVTLRRLVKSDKVQAEPRSDTRQPYKVTSQALLSAGLVITQVTSQPEKQLVLPNELDRLKADLEAAKIDRDALRAERERLIERASRAEGALEESRQAFQAALSSLEPAIKALTEKVEQVTSQPIGSRPVIDYLEQRVKRSFIDRLRSRK
jgi:predicted transcriptional regulator